MAQKMELVRQRELRVGGGRRSKTKLGEQRYAEVISLAAKLFAVQGFAGTSLNDLADAAGVLKGSLYHYIKSKEDLLYDVIKGAHQGLIDNMELADEFAASPRNQLVAFCSGHILLNVVEDRINSGTVFMRDMRFLNPDKKAAVVKVRTKYESYLQSIIKQGCAQGFFDPNLDSKCTSFLILGVITSYLRWYKVGGSITPYDLALQSATFVLKGIALDDKVGEEVAEIAKELEARLHPRSVRE